MAIRKRGTGWQCDLMLGGTRIRGTFDNAHAAEAFEMEARLAHKLGKPLPSPKPAKANGGTMKALLDDTARRWIKDKSPQTSYAQARLFVDYTGPLANPAAVLTDAYVATFIASIGDTRAGATINKRLAGISCLAHEAVKQGLIARKPIVEWRSDTGARDRYYTDDELTLIFDAQWSWQSAYRAPFMFLLDMGCRRGDLANIVWSDIRNGFVTFRHTKNDAPRTLPLSERCLSILRTAEKTQRGLPGPFTWITPHGVRSDWAKLRGVLPWLQAPDCVVHTFRHTCCSKLVQGGVELFEAQKWLGHKGPTMTARYAHLSPQSFGRMRNVLDAVTNPQVTKGL